MGHQIDTIEGNENPVCFVIMPISDNDKYSSGHFGRVYEYIIKPACIAAGFKPVRADDVKTTNYIALDIVKHIINAEMAICDLSSQNPNVLYEVGIRQAFNLPVTFIKDIATKRIFDIQGFRDVMYDENLRIDNVEKAILELTETLINTYHKKDEVNSLVTLLGIEPAKISNTPISVDTELILNAIKSLEYRVQVTERNQLYKKVRFVIPENFIAANPTVLQIGDEVFAEAFGQGKIVSIEGNPSNLKATIFFEGVGTKQLLLKLAKLFVPIRLDPESKQTSI